MEFENIDTAALEKELKKRAEKHNIKVGGTVMALNYDEMKAVKEQIDKFFPQPKMNWRATVQPAIQPNDWPFEARDNCTTGPFRRDSGYDTAKVVYAEVKKEPIRGLEQA